MDAFRDNKNLRDPSQLSAAFSHGKAQLEVAKRQSLLYSLYPPKSKNSLPYFVNKGSTAVVELVLRILKFCYG
ncbi:hypothetical protein Golob_023178 [Gossypium lobatum]|uniref:Uncharacterized protein n=1 Tax=Gossypium lobatum TaxID=34289 RepID=A0A7J8LIY5_9ROSI|nr:hypothetical protein [Gossypium lobatum]